MAAIQYRQAGPSDAEQVADAFIDSFSEDGDFWDYRHPYRNEYPEEHRKFVPVMTQAWLTNENSDCVMMVAEAPSTAYQNKPTTIVAFAVWNTSYIGKNTHGPEYRPYSTVKALRDAGSKRRRDAKDSRKAMFAAAWMQSHKRLGDAYGDEQLELTVLGTRPAFRRRGLGAALMRWGMDKARVDEGAVTAMASLAGGHLYGHLGFKDVGKEIVCQAPEEEEKVLFYAMGFDPKEPGT